MSQKNVEIVCKGLALFSAGDFEGTLELIDVDALWEPSGRFVGSGEEYRGHEAIRRFWAAFTDPWEKLTLDPVEAVALDEERVLNRHPFSRDRACQRHSHRDARHPTLDGQGGEDQSLSELRE